MRISLLMFAPAILLLSLACHDAATSTTPPATSDLPAGTLLVWWDDTLATVTTAGARLTVLMTGSTSLSISPEWSPDGSKAVIYEGDPAIDARISTLDMTGARTLVVGPSDSLHAASFPRFTRDGSWIYFSGNSGSGYMTYRVKPDGTQLERLGFTHTRFAVDESVPEWIAYSDPPVPMTWALAVDAYRRGTTAASGLR